MNVVTIETILCEQRYNKEGAFAVPGSVRLGNLAGIDIYINYSWLIIIVLLTISTASGWFPRAYPGYSYGTYLLLGLIAAILLFVSVLLHELAHSIVARAKGLPVKSIVLFIFGGVSNIEQEPQSPGSEFQIAIVGPVVSLLLGALSFLLLLPLGGVNSPVAAILAYLAAANVILGLFNLIPGFPLDGGRVLRSIIWKITGNPNRSTQITGGVGQVIAFLLILGGIWMFFGGDTLDGIWLGFIGWFLLSAAQAVRAQAVFDETFQGVTVEQIMKRDPMTVPANISIQKLLDDYLLPQGLRSALVMQGDVLAGIITLSDIRMVEREKWEGTPVGFAMVPIERLHVVAPEQSLKDVLPLMNDRDINQLPVVQNGKLVGVLSRDAILRSLEIRRNLKLDRVEQKV